MIHHPDKSRIHIQLSTKIYLHILNPRSSKVMSRPYIIVFLPQNICYNIILLPEAR